MFMRPPKWMSSAVRMLTGADERLMGWALRLEVTTTGMSSKRRSSADARGEEGACALVG
jgi:hypothetical protein